MVMISMTLAVQTQRHRPTQIAIVEGGFIPVDEQVAVMLLGVSSQNRLWQLALRVVEEGT